MPVKMVISDKCTDKRAADCSSLPRAKEVPKTGIFERSLFIQYSWWVWIRPRFNMIIPTPSTCKTLSFLRILCILSLIFCLCRKTSINSVVSSIVQCVFYIFAIVVEDGGVQRTISPSLPPKKEKSGPTPKTRIAIFD